MIRTPRFTVAAAVALAAALAPAAAQAQIVLSNLVVELSPGKDSRQDVEVLNNGSERAYVAVEPAEIVNPGTPAEARRSDPDPEKLGLLVAPSRMILEAGQRKLIRIAELAAPGDRERIYRVTVKPVVGPISSDQSGLKLLIGYDVLVLVRPAQPRPSVTVTRAGDTVTFVNDGNVSVELEQGRQCDPTDKLCSDLRQEALCGRAMGDSDQVRQPSRIYGEIARAEGSQGLLKRAPRTSAPSRLRPPSA
jgi:P pilus assembly chaperone PapD